MPKSIIGPLLNIGIEGTSLDPAVAALIRDYKLGGITLFTRNFESRRQLKSLTQQIRKAAGKNFILICVDQEGGRVQRLREGFTRIPPARELGKKVESQDNVSVLFNLFKKVGRELAAVGINVNFAPVLDIDTQPNNPIIGDRAFGVDPLQVGRCGVAVIRGLVSAKVLACGKHFPGHGDTSEDSHLTLPHVTTSRGVLEKRELLPFRAAIRAGLKLVMTAHVIYDSIDPLHPATLSPLFIRWLRQKLRFKGLILTDDLNMKGISDHWSRAEAIEKGLSAGIDQFLICRPVAGEIENLLSHFQKLAAKRPRLRAKMAISKSRITHLQW